MGSSDAEECAGDENRSNVPNGRPGVFRPGDEITRRWRVAKCIARGSHADIYLGLDVQTKKERILKVEAVRPGHSGVATEKDFILKDDVQRFRSFPQVYATGEFNNWRFIVMEVLGPSIEDLMGVVGRFTISCALRIGVFTLACIERVHRIGYIHRDVKPSNFLLRGDRASPIVLIDFGLVCPNPSRGGGFVGSVRYASVFAHEERPLSFRDDLWSWWYLLVKVLVGRLPWEERGKEQAYLEKMDTGLMEDMCRGLPRQIHAIYRTLVQVRLGDSPDYRLLRSFLVEAMGETGSRFDHPWDWEELRPRLLEKLHPVCLLKMNPDVMAAGPGDVILPAVVPGEAGPALAREPGCC